MRTTSFPDAPHTITPKTILDGDGFNPLLIIEATAAEIFAVARIERAARDAQGALIGFQRPAIEDHIQSITAYLNSVGAVLPNAIVLGFTAPAARLSPAGQLLLDLRQGPPGWVVDGQQRLLAATAANNPDRKLLVTAFLAGNVAELKRHFVLINTVRPLPRALIHEILPGLDVLPPRLTSEPAAQLLVESLNYRAGSSLRGLIRQTSNNRGLIRDTALLAVIRESLATGVLSQFQGNRDLLLTAGAEIISAFFEAVANTFPEAWTGHTPETSRLVHATGVLAMGRVMEALSAKTGASTASQFQSGLSPLVGRTAWTSGVWSFPGENRPWNSLQYVSRDRNALSRYLLSQLGLPEHNAADGNTAPAAEEAA